MMHSAVKSVYLVMRWIDLRFTMTNTRSNSRGLSIVLVVIHTCEQKECNHDLIREGVD